MSSCMVEEACESKAVQSQFFRLVRRYGGVNSSESKDKQFVGISLRRYSLPAHDSRIAHSATYISQMKTVNPHHYTSLLLLYNTRRQCTPCRFLPSHYTTLKPDVPRLSGN